MKAYLCQIDGWSGSTATSVYLASHDDPSLCHLNGQTWWPAIAKLPTLRYDFFDGAFGGQITAPTGEMEITLDALPTLPGLALHDARVQLWQGELGAAWGGFTLIFDGRVQDQPEIGDGLARVSIGADDSWLDQPLLGTYAGSGGIEGGADLKGNAKPLLFGAPRFVDAVGIDTVNNVYQLSNGAINAVELAFDRLSRFAAATGDDANLTALLAASIPAGSWRTCLASGLVRLGAPPEGLLTFHVQGDNGGAGGWVRKPGAIIARIAAIMGASAKVNSASLTALDTARPWNISLALTEQTTPRAVIQRIAQSVNAVAVVDWLGVLRVLPVPAPEAATAQATLAADGSALPPVIQVAQAAISPPFWRVSQQAVVTSHVHGDSDIAYYDSETLAAFLTNESATVAAASDGTVASFAGTGGTFVLYDGLLQITSGVVFSVASSTGVTIGIDASTGVYTITAMSADTGTATLRAAYAGVTIDKVYSISKARAGSAGSNGTNGANAKTLTLLSDRQTISYDAAGSASPSTQTTTFSTNKQNTTATVNWSITDANGTPRTPVATYLSAATGDSVTMTEAQFASARNGTSGVIVTASLTDGTTISDKISIVRVQAGADGFGSNAVTNSDWIIDDAGFYGVAIWGGASGPTFGYSRDMGGYGGSPRHALQSRIASPTYPTGALPNSYFFGPGQLGFDGNIANLKTYGLPVVQGDTLFWSGRLAIHGGTVGYVRVRIFNGSGALVEEYDVGGTQGDGRRGGPTGANGDPANYHLWQGIHAVTNAAAAYAVISCYMMTDAGPAFGDTDAYLFFTEPMLTKVAAGQTVYPPYTSGPALRNADNTASNTSANTSNVGSQTAGTVNSGVTAANAGLDASGNVQPNKVATGAIVTNAISGSSYITFGPLAYSGFTYTTVGTLTITPLSTADVFLIYLSITGYQRWTVSPLGYNVRLYNGPTPLDMDLMTTPESTNAYTTATTWMAELHGLTAPVTLELKFKKLSGSNDAVIQNGILGALQLKR